MFSPIILFTYCRPEHTRKTVESLKLNIYASDSDLYVYSDAAKNAKAEKGVNLTRDYIKSICGFKSITIIEREYNWGLANNLINGITNVINKHGSAIIVEDDLVTSPYFLQYMNEALEKYKDCKQVGEILGYLHNTKYQFPETFFSLLWGCWGWATWKDRWECFNPDSSDLYNRIISDRDLVRRFDVDFRYENTRMLRDQKNGLIDSWAIRWAASNFLLGKYCLRPGRSLVKQIGLDGQPGATHCSKTSLYDVDVSESPIQLTIEPSEISDSNDFWKETKQHRTPSWQMRIRKYIYLMHLHVLLGKISNKLSWI